MISGTTISHNFSVSPLRRSIALFPSTPFASRHWHSADRTPLYQITKRIRLEVAMLLPLGHIRCTASGEDGQSRDTRFLWARNSQSRTSSAPFVLLLALCVLHVVQWHGNRNIKLGGIKLCIYKSVALANTSMMLTCNSTSKHLISS